MRLTLPSTSFLARIRAASSARIRTKKKDDQRFQKNLFAKQLVGLHGFLLRQRLHYIPDSTGDQADQCPPSALFGKQNCRRYHRQNQKRRPRKHFPIREVLLILVQRVHIMNAPSKHRQTPPPAASPSPALSAFLQTVDGICCHAAKKAPRQKIQKTDRFQVRTRSVVRFASKCSAPIDSQSKTAVPTVIKGPAVTQWTKRPCDFIV